RHSKLGSAGPLMVWNSLALDRVIFSGHGIDCCRRSTRTGGTGDARTICGGALSRSRSLRECVRYLPQDSILTCSLVRLFSAVLIGGLYMPGDSHGLIESWSSIQD